MLVKNINVPNSNHIEQSKRMRGSVLINQAINALAELCKTQTHKLQGKFDYFRPLLYRCVKLIN